MKCRLKVFSNEISFSILVLHFFPVYLVFLLLGFSRVSVRSCICSFPTVVSFFVILPVMSQSDLPVYVFTGSCGSLMMILLLLLGRDSAVSSGSVETPFPFSPPAALGCHLTLLHGSPWVLMGECRPRSPGRGVGRGGGLGSRWPRSPPRYIEPSRWLPPPRSSYNYSVVCGSPVEDLFRAPCTWDGSHVLLWLAAFAVSYFSPAAENVARVWTGCLSIYQG